jgi:tetratricopeptide (TPR) repeat protein
MRVPSLLLAALAVTLSPLPMYAQGSAFDQIVAADGLRYQGEPKAAVAILESMVQAQASGMAESDLGLAWNVLGSSYEDLHMPEKAKLCYETAIEKLRPIPSAQAKHAAAIANLAALEGSEGQMDSAMVLYEKSNRIYEGIGDSGGVTVTSTDLATLMFAKKDFKAARRYLAKAFAASERTSGLRDDDIAGLFSVKSALALHEQESAEAISDSQQAIDRWTHAHGPGYYMLAVGYDLRAQATANTGDYGHALTDAQRALAIVEGANGKETVAYLKAEIVYAQVLQASGAREQAARLRKEASSALANLESRQCRGCTIDANGFR